MNADQDRRLARFLIRALAEDHPTDLKGAHRDAHSRGPRWRERIETTLAAMTEEAAILAAL